LGRLKDCIAPFLALKLLSSCLSFLLLCLRLTWLIECTFPWQAERTRAAILTLEKRPLNLTETEQREREREREREIERERASKQTTVEIEFRSTLFGVGLSIKAKKPRNTQNMQISRNIIQTLRTLL
jgi:hypothetical protein